MDLLTSLLKAGGISALAIGVVYLLYREIIKLGVVPRLKQWQGFALLCLLAILVFTVAMTVLWRSNTQNVVSTQSYFQLDSRNGIFCEEKSVDKPFPVYFDSIDINLGNCPGSSQFSSRSYRVDWQSSPSKEVAITSRKGFDHCLASDFGERAPKFLESVTAAFKRNGEEIPCKLSVYMMRQIRLSYIDLQNQSQSREAAFVQFYNRGGSGKLEIEAVPTTNLARSDQMNGIAQQSDGEVSDATVRTIAAQYPNLGIPRK